MGLNFDDWLESLPDDERATLSAAEVWEAAVSTNKTIVPDVYIKILGVEDSMVRVSIEVGISGVLGDKIKMGGDLFVRVGDTLSIGNLDKISLTTA